MKFCFHSKLILVGWILLLIFARKFKCLFLHSCPDVVLGAKNQKSCSEKIHEKKIDIFVTFLGEIFFSKKNPNSNFGLGDKVQEKGDEEDKRWNLVSLSHFLSTISTETKFLMTSIQLLVQKIRR